RFGEYPRLRAMIRVEHTNSSAIKKQRDAQGRLQALSDDTLDSGKAWIIWHMHQDQRLALFQGGADHVAAEGPVLRELTRLIPIARFAYREAITIGVAQHQVGAFSPGQTDDAVQHLVQHLVQLQRRGDARRTADQLL